MKQKKKIELQSIMWFVDKQEVVTPEDVDSFFGWSDKGIRYESTPGTDALSRGKTLRDYQVNAWRSDKWTIMFPQDFDEYPDYMRDWAVDKVFKP